MWIQRLIWLAGLVALLTTACKREEPQPGITEVNMLVVDESRKPLANVEILIAGSTGSYFTGTRIDTVFAREYTNINGVMLYKRIIEDRWRLYAKPMSPFDSTGKIAYDVVKFEGTVDTIVNVGEVNNITAILRKR